MPSTIIMGPETDVVFLNRAWRLVDALAEQQQFVSVLVAHTFIEGVLIDLIRERLHDANQLPPEDFDRMGFAQIVKWALALNAVPTDLKGSLAKLNDYRNAFAHNIDHDALSTEQVQELYTTLPKLMRDSVKRGIAQPQNVGKLSETLFALAAELVRHLDGKFTRAAYFDPDRRTLSVVLKQGKRPRALGSVTKR